MSHINFSNKSCVGIKLCKRLEDALEIILSFQKQPNNICLCFTILGESEMQKLNKQSRGIDKVTDVLSFPSMNLTAGDIINADKVPWLILPNGELELGDVVVCKSVAESQAKDFNHALNDEIVRLFLHSVLHLLGYDHIKNSDYSVMNSIEDKLWVSLK